jgi:hypothetical protein
MSFIVASAPAQGLDIVVSLARKYGGTYTAGTATDKLNSIVGDDASIEDRDRMKKPWFIAWQGKTGQAIQMLTSASGGAAITLVAIAGGPACDTERHVLRSIFCKQYPNCTLKQIGDIEDFEAWLARTYGGGSAGGSRGGGSTTLDNVLVVSGAGSIGVNGEYKECQIDQNTKISGGLRGIKAAGGKAWKRDLTPDGYLYQIVLQHSDGSWALWDCSDGKNMLCAYTAGKNRGPPATKWKVPHKKWESIAPAPTMNFK